MLLRQNLAVKPNGVRAVECALTDTLLRMGPSKSVGVIWIPSHEGDNIKILPRAQVDLS